MRMSVHSSPSLRTCAPLAGPGAYRSRSAIIFSLSYFSLGSIDPCGRGGVREHLRERTRTGGTEPARHPPPAVGPDRAAVRLRNDFERRFHALSILHRAYACQGIYRQGPRQQFQSACGDAPSDAFLAGVNCRILRLMATLGAYRSPASIRRCGIILFPSKRSLSNTISPQKRAFSLSF